MQTTESHLKIAIAQLNMKIGDIHGNTERILSSIESAKSRDADLIVFSELAITGYPPEDLLFRSGFHAQVSLALEKIAQATARIDVIVGYPRLADDVLYNSAAYIRDGAILASYDKWILPNYSVFDEKRYFNSGNEACVVELRGVKLGLSVCEDIWEVEPTAAAVASGAQIIISMNASPFHRRKHTNRESCVAQRIAENHVPVIYLNQIGGQDELVFDGASFVMGAV